MNTLKPLFLIIGLQAGYIIVQLLIDTGIGPGMKATVLMLSIPSVLAVAGWKIGGMVDKKRNKKC